MLPEVPAIISNCPVDIFKPYKFAPDSYNLILLGVPAELIVAPKDNGAPGVAVPIPTFCDVSIVTAVVPAV